MLVFVSAQSRKISLLGGSFDRKYVKRIRSLQLQILLDTIWVLRSYTCCRLV
jgi:hypothetical protein